MSARDLGFRTVGVQVQLGIDGTPVLSCDPPMLCTPPDMTSIFLVFTLQQTGTSDWIFPRECSAEDDFYGVRIRGDIEHARASPARATDSLVLVLDTNDQHRHKDYYYSITLYNQRTGETLGHHHDLQHE